MLFYDNGKDYRNELQSFWNGNVKKFRTSSLVGGILMVILGILCAAFPFQSMIAMEYIASILLIVVGIAQIYAASQVPIFLRTGGTILGGILNIILGILLLTSPADVMLGTFAFIIAINLMLFGVEECVAYNRVKFFQAEGGGWLLFEGIVNIIVSIIFLFLPQTSIAISYLFAFYLLVTGIASICASVAARELKIRD
ncbi:MAG: DUF308 domain-containing protein [Lachnospiraceae bacterium]|jgi:uncharacterized membrane protein HdeD (DUF308 family)